MWRCYIPLFAKTISTFWLTVTWKLAPFRSTQASPGDAGYSPRISRAYPAHIPRKMNLRGFFPPTQFIKAMFSCRPHSHYIGFILYHIHGRNRYPTFSCSYYIRCIFRYCSYYSAPLHHVTKPFVCRNFSWQLSLLEN